MDSLQQNSPQQGVPDTLPANFFNGSQSQPSIPNPVGSAPDTLPADFFHGGGGGSTPSTDGEGSLPENLASGAADFAANVTKGVAKGVLSTTSGLGDIIHKAGEFVHPGLGEALVPQSGLTAEQAMTHPQGTAQHVGYGGETLLEMFMGDEALKGLSVADKALAAGKAMKTIEKSPKLMEAAKLGAAQLAKQSGRAGLVQAGQTFVRSGGDVKEAAESGLEGAATNAALGTAFGTVGTLARKAGVAGKAASELADTAANAPDKQTLAENIQGQLQNAKENLHTNYEAGINDIQNRLGNNSVEVKDSPVSNKAKELLAKPDPDDHDITKQAKELAGEKIDKSTKELLESYSNGTKPLTEEDIQAAKNASKPTGLLGPDGKPLPAQTVQPQPKPAEPLTATDLIQQRQAIRAAAAGYEPGNINARVLNNLLGGFDDTMDQIAAKSSDPSAVSDYQKLRANYKTKIGPYNNNPVIKNLIAGKVDDAAKGFIATKSASGLPTAGKTDLNTDQLRTVLGDAGFTHFRDTVFDNLMKNASDDNGFNPAKFMGTWNKVAEGTKGNFFGAASDQENVLPQNYVQSLISDTKSAANMQKAVRAGLITGVGGAASVAHPIVGGLGTVLAFVLGHEGAGGIAKGRDILDYVANHPKTWATLRGLGKASNSTAAAIAAKGVTAAARGAEQVNNNEDDSDKTDQYGAAQSTLGGSTPNPNSGKPLTALADGPDNTAPSADATVTSSNPVVTADRAVENLPSQVRNAVSTIPVNITQGQAMNDPNGRDSSRAVAANVDQGAGNNTIEINSADALNKNPTATIGHEITHVWQNNLPPSVQAKIPDDPKDMSAFDISDVDKLRKQGKTMVDIPREKAATIVQKYIEAKPDSAVRKKLQPWIEDMGNTPLSSTMPTSPDAKRLNMAPRPPGLPNGVAGLEGVKQSLSGSKAKKKGN